MPLPTVDSLVDGPRTFLSNGPSTAPDAAFGFRCEGLSATPLRVYRIQGHEKISQPFRFDVTVVAESASLDLHASIGRTASLTMKGQDAPGIGYRREIHGRIERFVQLSAGKRYSQYQATLSPTLFPLSYTRNARIFRELSTVRIVQKVLGDGHIPDEQIQFLLHANYAPRDFCVQYQESDLAFLNRLLEEEGIFYFFRHEDGKDIVVFGDGPHAIEAVPHAGHLPYRDHPHRYEEVIHSLRAEARFRPGATVLRDFRFKHPGLDMEARQTAAQFADCQVYYYPGDYVEPELGQRLAKIRHEEIQCERSQISAESSSPALMPGHTFQLEGHGRADLSRGYLLVSVEHEGTQPQVLAEEQAGAAEPQYKSHITCIPDDVVFRPARQTPRPCIQGVQSAVVVGPGDEEIHCDAHGRVKVQFHWDRSGQRNDQSSCWIRVSHPWAGAGYGGMFIPRVGQEVLVQFLEGDPDRPVIVGRVYNGENPVPHALPDQKNVTTLRTTSTPGGQGFNEIRFTDTAGQEELFVHAQRNRNEVVEHDHNLKVGNNQVICVQKELSTTAASCTIITAESLHLRSGENFININPSGITIHGAKISNQASGEYVITGSKVKIN